MNDRLAIDEVRPLVSCGRFPSKSVVGEVLPISATVWREGHDAVAASLVVRRPGGSSSRSTMVHGAEADTVHALLHTDVPGMWSFRVEAWSDPYATWRSGLVKKMDAGQGAEVLGNEFEVGARVLDAGASTGGFTQVCLEAGAATVYAVDVGHGQLDPTLRADPRVVVHERTNLRDLSLEHTGGLPVGLVVADVSFISLRLLLPALLGVLEPSGTALLLVKPQFEVGRGGLDGHGVVRDPVQREAAVGQVAADAAALGWPVSWRGDSRLPGEHGNREYFLALSQGTVRVRA